MHTLVTIREHTRTHFLVTLAAGGGRGAPPGMSTCATRSSRSSVRRPRASPRSRELLADRTRHRGHLRRRDAGLRRAAAPHESTRAADASRRHPDVSRGIRSASTRSWRMPPSTTSSARMACAVVVGGTGLYLRAALVDLDIPPGPPAPVRERWERRYDRDPAAAYAELADRDPAAATLVHRERPPARRSCTRARARLAPLSSRGATLWAPRSRRPTLVVGLDVPADELERRIGERTRVLFERGVVEEVRAALTAASRRRPKGARAPRARDAPGRGGARSRSSSRTRRYAATSASGCDASPASS